MEFTNELTIQRAPHDVFAYLAAFENVPKWNYAIVETRKTSEGPVGVGATYTHTRSIPTRSEETFEVIEYEPNRLLAIKGDLGPFTGVLTYELSPDASGTRIINRAALQARGLSRLASPLAAGRVREAVGTNLRALKELLEA